MKAIVYDGLSGSPVEEEALLFLLDYQAQLRQLPTPTPALIMPDTLPPARPVGKVLRASLAATLQSASFQDHDRAARGLDRVEGSEWAET